MPQGRVANFTAKRLRIATPRVSLSFLFRNQLRRFSHSITFFLSSFSLRRSPLSILLYFSHQLRCAPLLLFLNQCEQHFLFPVITRNQRKSTEPTDKRRHESVTTRTRRYDTAATIENLRGGVSREGGGTFTLETTTASRPV